MHRLKLQREKIEALYCKYDVLLGDLKAKELLIKEKDRKIGELEARLKSLLQANEQHSLSKQQVLGIKSENTLLLSSLSQLEEQYNSLHNRLKAKESSATQRHVELEAVVQELMAKLKTVSKKLIDKEQEIADQAKEASNRLETQQLEAGKEKTQLLEDISALRNELLRQDEESNILYSENDCLKQRVKEL